MIENKLEKIVSLAKRRGFIFPGSEIYGGQANSWDFGPLGVELKNNIKQLWWKRFVHERDDVVGIDAALIMNPKVWEASGHLKEFSDPLLECTNCRSRLRADDLQMRRGGVRGEFDAEHPERPINFDNLWDAGLYGRAIREYPDVAQVSRWICGHCNTGNKILIPRQFNLMLKTFLGPVEDAASSVYLRPETAQAMFVDFKHVLDTVRKKIPFGIAQIGKAFRNEITPGNFIFRTREFEQMELEYFIREEQWQEQFEYWLNEMKKWLKDLGIKNYELVEIPDGERAHYSKRTIDIEYKFPFGQKELYGLAYRGDFDLKNHFKEPPYREDTGDPFYPHVIEPTWGVERTVLAVLLEAYDESEKDRVVLKLRPRLAPYKAAVFPLLANKPQLVVLARKIYDDLRKEMNVAFDDRGNLGKRYYAQDEIGTPTCVTVDFQSLEDNTVTLRNRDTTKQKRISIKKIPLRIKERMVE